MLESVIAIPLFLVLGLVMGSFGNVIISRVPEEESITGRSKCPRCGRKLTAWELIPVISWIILRGKCHGCRKPISLQYPLVELVTAGLFVAAIMMNNGNAIMGLPLSIALWSMVLITVIDLRTQMIPDALTIVLALSALAYRFMMGDVSIEAAIIGLCFFGLQWIVSKGRWVGSGDVFLAGALGLLIGSWQLMILALMLSYIIGAAVSLILIATGRIKKTAHISFGPFLILGTVITFLWGQQILGFVLPY